MNISCHDCRKECNRPRWHIDRAIKLSGVYRCKSCTVKALNARRKPQIGGERSAGHGYIEVLTTEGWVLRNRLVMSQHLGRPLAPDEHVQHINRVRGDDCIENLRVLSLKDRVSLRQRGAKREGQALQNIRDGVRSRACVKLTPAHAASIRLRVKAGHSQRSIARDFRVSPMTVNRIVKGKRWVNSTSNGWSA